jgi:hypothetical protein
MNYCQSAATENSSGSDQVSQQERGVLLVSEAEDLNPTARWLLSPLRAFLVFGAARNPSFSRLPSMELLETRSVSFLGEMRPVGWRRDSLDMDQT